MLLISPEDAVQAAFYRPRADQSVVLGGILWHALNALPGPAPGSLEVAAVFVTRDAAGWAELRAGDSGRLIVMTPGRGGAVHLFRVWPVLVQPGRPADYPHSAAAGRGIYEFLTDPPRGA